MPTIKLSKSAINCIPLSKQGQAFYYDTRLPGFGLRVGQNSKTYFVEKRVNGKTRRVTIGRHGIFTCEQAKREALRLLGQMASGHDPNAERVAAKVQGITLEQAFEEFLKVRDHKEKTAYTYTRLMVVAFSEWARKPMTAITKNMVATHHENLGMEHGPAYADLAMRLLRSIWNFAAARYEDSAGEMPIPQNPVT
ncbi:MAG: Arm DNA-binding domain-containing protein, partial [Alphaproteobacteria bacterium]